MGHFKPNFQGKHDGTHKKRPTACILMKNGFISFIRAVATAPEKTPTGRGKFSELQDHHQSLPCQILPLEKQRKVATPYLHGASAIRPRRRPDALSLNVILRLNRCLELDGMR